MTQQIIVEKIRNSNTRQYAASLASGGKADATTTAEFGSSHAIAIKRLLASYGIKGDVRKIGAGEDGGTLYEVRADVPPAPETTQDAPQSDPTTADVPSVPEASEVPQDASSDVPAPADRPPVKFDPPRSIREDLPTIEELTERLQRVRLDSYHCHDGDWIDVRLQVIPDQGWMIRIGDASFDQDHRGYWGAGSVSAEDDDESLRDTAESLISEAIDHFWQCGEAESEAFERSARSAW